MKKNVVLLLNGCFNPIHENHLRLLELSRKHLESLDIYQVVGGYLSPSHDASIERKISTTFLTWRDRLEMCRLAVGNSSWILIDDWQISQEKNRGAQQAKQRLNDILRRRDSSIEIISICGGDALPKLKSTFKKEKIVCIVNRPIVEFDFEEFYQSDQVKMFHENIFLIRDDFPVCSSTWIREQISLNRFDLVEKHLHPAVIEYHQRRGINYRSTDETVIWAEFDSHEIELGKGRCAIVYEKKYKNEFVAVKVIRERKQFLNESKVLRVLMNEENVHSNLVRIFAIGNQFVVMEKCQTDLLSYLIDNRFNENQTLETKFPDRHWTNWIEQMIDGFSHLNSLGILHRDIKTDNILLLNSTIKISDFSVSIDVNNLIKMPPRGSIRYYSPESIDDKTIYTEKSDVFMFGCLLFEIIHGGERLWNSLNTPEVVQRRANGERPIVNVPCEEFYVEMINERCWTIDPDQRATFEQLRKKFQLSLKKTEEEKDRSDERRVSPIRFE